MSNKQERPISPPLRDKSDKVCLTLMVLTLWSTLMEDLMVIHQESEVQELNSIKKAFTGQEVTTVTVLMPIWVLIVDPLQELLEEH